MEQSPEQATLVKKSIFFSFQNFLHYPDLLVSAQTDIVEEIS